MIFSSIRQCLEGGGILYLSEKVPPDTLNSDLQIPILLRRTSLSGAGVLDRHTHATESSIYWQRR
jgi:hypothetical protein